MPRSDLMPVGNGASAVSWIRCAPAPLDGSVLLFPGAFYPTLSFTFFQKNRFWAENVNVA
jgi:hypothetical protein